MVSPLTPQATFTLVCGANIQNTPTEMSAYRFGDLNVERKKKKKG